MFAHFNAMQKIIQSKLQAKQPKLEVNMNIHIHTYESLFILSPR